MPLEDLFKECQGKLARKIEHIPLKICNGDLSQECSKRIYYKKGSEKWGYTHYCLYRGEQHQTNT